MAKYRKDPKHMIIRTTTTRQWTFSDDDIATLLRKYIGLSEREGDVTFDVGQTFLGASVTVTTCEDNEP